MANTKGRNGRRRGRPSLIYGEYEGEEWKEERKTKLDIWRIRRGGMEGGEEDQAKDMANTKGRNGRRRGRPSLRYGEYEGEEWKEERKTKIEIWRIRRGGMEGGEEDQD